MGYGKYGTFGARRRAGFPWLELISIFCLLAAVGLAFVQLVSFANQQETFPSGTCVGVVCLDNLTRAEAVAALEQAYASGIVLMYKDNPIILEPSSIGFRLNSDTIMAEIENSIEQKSFWEGFWDFIWRRPNVPVTVEISSQFIPSQLRAFLEDVALRYDQPPAPASYDLNTFTFRDGQPGYTMDIETSLPLVEAALQDPTNRMVELVVEETDAPKPDLATLRNLILAYFDSIEFVYDGRNQLASIFIMDLQTGQEISINADIAFAGMSMIKIPILADMFRKMDYAANEEEAYLIAQTMICSGNFTANLLLQIVGNGNQCAGADDVTNMLQELGLRNTFLTASLAEAGAQECPFVTRETPANQNPSYNTRPDPQSQTTPEDIGTLLGMIYECATHGGGGLIAAYPDQFTPNECQQMIEVMQGNRIGVLLEKGVPENTRVAHKHGWIEDTHGDVGIVFTPGGDYVLAMMFYNETFLNYQAYWPVMEDISRATYNLFNPTAPLLASRETTPAEECRVDERARQVVDLNNIEPFIQVVLPDQARTLP